MLEGKSIHTSSKSDPWKYLHMMVRTPYPWQSLLFEDRACSWTQNCSRLKQQPKMLLLLLLPHFDCMFVKWLLYCFYYLSIWDTCVQEFNIKSNQIGVIWDIFYWVYFIVYVYINLTWRHLKLCYISIYKYVFDICKNRNIDIYINIYNVKCNYNSAQPNRSFNTIL